MGGPGGRMGPNAPMGHGMGPNGPMGPPPMGMGPMPMSSMSGPMPMSSMANMPMSSMGGPMGPGPMGPGNMSMSGPGGPMPVSSSGMTIPTGPGSGSPHGSNPGTPLSGNVPMGPSSHPGNIPMGPSSHPGMGGQSPGMGPGGPSPGHPGMGGPSPLSMSSEKIYPSDQPMVFNPQNPNAPPIYPCGICHKEVHDNDQAILCESGCNFWFHRICTGLAEQAFHFLTQEIYAEWVCDKCFSQKDVPLVKFKP